MNGIMFGGEGPIMKGTWYNPNTGDVFTVRDSFFEDNNYVVTTTDGRCLNYNQIQHYIQSDAPVETLKSNMQHNEEIPESIKSMIDTNYEEDSISSLLIPEDNIYSNPVSLGNINDNSRNTTDIHVYAAYNNEQQKLYSKPVNINTTIIEKGLKNTTGPKLTIIVDWDDYPAKEIEMLTGMMEIPSSEIAEWYCNNLDTSWVLDDVKQAIYNKLTPTKIIEVEEKIEEHMEQDMPKVSKPKKKNKK